MTSGPATQPRSRQPSSAVIAPSVPAGRRRRAGLLEPSQKKVELTVDAIDVIGGELHGSVSADFLLDLLARISSALYGFLDRVLGDIFLLRLVADFMILNACDFGSILRSASGYGCHRSLLRFDFGHQKTSADSRSSDRLRQVYEWRHLPMHVWAATIR
ncbi:hypothetical protein AGR6A_pa20047 [Agrobacterium sp. NCPPB 925]|nr:hypothetical protein AGR6A_pa20047 [Agrobacterium sp. NCPPB 925]